LHRKKPIHFMLFAILGGALIGLSASLFWSLNGRVAGVSGVLAGAFKSTGGERRVRLLFLLGLLLAGLLFGKLVHPIAVSALPLLPLALAGLFVGVGTRLGGGCTSGHGVCGLSRLSTRSLVATLTFIATGALTVLVVRHGLSLWGPP
jgi:uncharacterized membrane protein YedE/YeeE